MRLYRARPGNHLKITAAYLQSAYVHHRVRRVKFPVGALEGFGDPFDGLHYFKPFQKIGIQLAGIADKPDNGCKFPF